MDSKLSDIELLIAKLDLERKWHQLLERRHAVQQHHAGPELRAVELLIEKLRLEKLRETLRDRRRFERNGPLRRTGFTRAL
ncbi:hypothetical protein [Rhodoferax sp. UBA5149]|uniref:hypothetical protein n=1 Tax=Rhodoferax sp. UBA5149 TaxID=1947379 RepID=UPI0025F973DA|nr:hypothetical protein [Rhodoferax sp. UBA5149]